MENKDTIEKLSIYIPAFPNEKHTCKTISGVKLYGITSSEYNQGINYRTIPVDFNNTYLSNTDYNDNTDNTYNKLSVCIIL